MGKRTIKSEHDAGYNSASETIKEHGIERAQAYYDSKEAHGWSIAPLIVAYWKGYFDRLIAED